MAPKRTITSSKDSGTNGLSPQIEKRRPKRNAGWNKMSPLSQTRSPAKVARASRLQPSQPLHMTTRRAASRVATNSTAGSIASVDSRRSSFDDTTQIAGGVDIDADRPTKKARLSDRSSTTTGTTTRSVVRRQQSTTPEPVVASNQDIDIPDIITTVEPPSRIQEDRDRATPPGDESVAGGRQDDGRDSEAQHQPSPLPKRRGRRPKVKRAFTPTASVAESIAPGTPQNGDLNENGTDRDAPKARRLPGRRRAPNADPLVEACLRRQLQLRIGHRAVSKALKPVLIELARRTTANLQRRDAEEELADVVAQLTAELDRALQARLKILNDEHRLKTTYHEGKLERETEYLDLQYLAAMRKMQEDYGAHVQNSILELARQYEHELDEDATDDEDGHVVPPLHGRPTLRNPIGWLDPRFDSRSRYFLETERLAAARDLRIHIGRQQEDALLNIHDGDDSDDTVDVQLDQFPDGFGTIDEARRSYAIAALNVHALARATKVVEDDARLAEARVQQIPANTEALGLQALVAAMEIAQIPPPPINVPISKPVLYHQQPPQPAPATQNPPVERIEQPSREQPFQDSRMQNGHYPPPPELQQQFYARLQNASQEPLSQHVSSAVTSPTKSYPSHSRHTSDSAAGTQQPVQQSPRYAHAYVNSTTSPENPSQYFQSSEPNVMRSPRNELSPHLRRILHPVEQAPPPPSPRQHRSIWQNLLDESKATTSSPTEDTRRRSDTSITGAHPSHHTRTISVPIAGPLSSVPESSPRAQETQPAQAAYPPAPAPLPYYQHSYPPVYNTQPAPQQSPTQQPPKPFFGPRPPPQLHPAGQYPYSSPRW